MSVSERPPARERLSADRIVAEALELAREEGVRGISMRPLAARFGVSATALYGHVASRDALLGLMVDATLADLPPLAAELDWDAALREAALQLRVAFGPYPQLALEALGGHAITTQTQLNRDDLLRRLVSAGFDEEEGARALTCWGRWTLSFLAAAEHAAPGAPGAIDRAFLDGVEYLLEGLRTQRAAHGARGTDGSGSM